MKEQAKVYWENFWKEKTPPENVVFEQFGWEDTPLADELAQLIVEGKKTATCGAYLSYQMEDEEMPKEGLYTVVLKSQNEPVAIIRTTEVFITPMNEVPKEFAKEEGEGDLSFEYWWEGHERFFTTVYESLGREFTPDIPVVCERFELIDVRSRI
ncbi:MAG: ASCH domain-containing protein [Streptococcaceae bacterium]|jgi:uncharacterized protein YhfF|nr:ASCH domain-containing protein [Streptococcaceae bacterium]